MSNQDLPRRTTADLLRDLQLVEADVEAAQGVLEGELLQRWEAAATALADKAEAVAFFLEDQEAKAEAARALAKRAQSRARTLDNNVERLKRHLLHVMGERKSIEGDGVRLVRAANPGSIVIDHAPSVYAYDRTLCSLERIPDSTVLDGVAYAIKPDKTLIRAALKNGEQVTGARHVEGGERLDVKLG